MKLNARLFVNKWFFFQPLIRRALLNVPYSEQELYGSSLKEITFIADGQKSSMAAFKLASLHFPKTWGFLWRIQENSLSTTILNYSEEDREIFYQELKNKESNWLRERTNKAEHYDIVEDGLLALGGENGKRIISEAYQCVGLPLLVSYNSDLVFANLKNKVPMKWIVSTAPVAFNIHPAPPEKRGAGVCPLIIGW